jgi:hypothetical protein
LFAWVVVSVSFDQQKIGEREVGFAMELHMDLARDEIRCLPRDAVALHIDTKEGSEEMLRFWNDRGEDLYRHFRKSQKGIPDCFVSYTWEWETAAQFEARFAFGLMKSWIIFDAGRNWTLWVDKGCVDHTPEGILRLARYSFFFVENIMLSRNFMVILNDTYFTRLWCVYEFCIGIATKDPSNIVIALTPFLDVTRKPKVFFSALMESVVNLSVSGCRCQM